MNTITAVKKELRHTALKRRRELAEAEPMAIEQLADQFHHAFTVAADIRLAGFWPMADELDVRPILDRHAGNRGICFLPRVDRRGTPLVFRQWTPGAPLNKSAFGVMEPSADAPSGQPDILLVPLLAFDRRGYRLGYGGGYYDRSLAALRHARTGKSPIVAIGVAYDGQEVDSLPVERFDQRLDWILTPTGARQFTPISDS